MRTLWRTIKYKNRQKPHFLGQMLKRVQHDEVFGREKEKKMSVITATVARTNLYKLIDKTKESHEPILISGKRNNAVLISEEDWKSIQETLFLCSIPGMRESILEASKEPLEESVKELDW